MSRESIIKFYEEVRKNEKLKKEFEAIKNQVEKGKETKEEGIAKKITVLAKKNGFDFTEKELLNYMEEVKNTLTEEELLDVSGGRMSAKAAGLGLMGTLMLSFATGAAFNLAGQNIGSTPMQQQEVALDNEEKTAGEETEEEKLQEDMDATGATTNKGVDLGRMFRGGGAPSGRAVTSKSKLGNLDLKGKTPILEAKKDEGKTVNVAENKATPVTASSATTTTHTKTPQTHKKEEAIVTAAAPEVEKTTTYTETPQVPKEEEATVTAAQTELPTAEGKLKTAQENYEKAVEKRDAALKDPVVRYYDAIGSVSHNWLGSEWDLTVTMKKGQTAPKKDGAGWNEFLLAAREKLNRSKWLGSSLKDFNLVRSVTVDGAKVAEYAGANRANPGDLGEAKKKIDDFEKVTSEVEKTGKEVKNQQAQVDKAKKNKEAAEAAEKAAAEKAAAAKKEREEAAEKAEAAKEDAEKALEQLKAERAALEAQRKEAEESPVIQYCNYIEKVDGNTGFLDWFKTSEWDLNVTMKEGKTAPEKGTAEWDQFLLAVRTKLDRSDFTFAKLRTVCVNGEPKAQYDDADNGRPNIIEDIKMSNILDSLSKVEEAESKAQAAVKQAAIAAEKADTRFSNGWQKLSGVFSSGQEVKSNDQTSHISAYAVDVDKKEIVLKVDGTDGAPVDIDDILGAMRQNKTLKDYQGYKVTLSQDSNVVLSDYMLMEMAEGAAPAAFRVDGDTVYLKCKTDESLLKDTGAKDTEALVSSLVAQWNAQHKGEAVNGDAVQRIMITTDDAILHYNKEDEKFVNLQEAAKAILESQIEKVTLAGTKVVVTVKEAYKDKEITINEAFLKALDMKLGGSKINFGKLDSIEFINAKVGNSTEGGTTEDDNTIITFGDAEKEALAQKSLYLNEIAKGTAAWKIAAGVSAGVIPAAGGGAVASYYGLLGVKAAELAGQLGSYLGFSGGAAASAAAKIAAEEAAAAAAAAAAKAAARATAIKLGIGIGGGAAAVGLLAYLTYQGYQYLFGTKETDKQEEEKKVAELAKLEVSEEAPAVVEKEEEEEEEEEEDDVGGEGDTAEGLSDDEDGGEGEDLAAGQADAEKKEEVAAASSGGQKVEEVNYDIEWQGRKRFGGIFSGGQTYDISFTANGKIMSEDEVLEHPAELYGKYSADLVRYKIENINLADGKKMTFDAFKSAALKAAKGEEDDEKDNVERGVPQLSAVLTDGNAGGGDEKGLAAAPAAAAPEAQKDQVYKFLTDIEGGYEVKTDEEGIYKIMQNGKEVKVDMGYYINVAMAFLKLGIKYDSKLKFHSYTPEGVHYEVTMDYKNLYTCVLLKVKTNGGSVDINIYGGEGAAVTLNEESKAQIKSYTITNVGENKATVKFKVDCTEDCDLKSKEFETAAKEALKDIILFPSEDGVGYFGEGVTFEFEREEKDENDADANPDGAGGGEVD